MTRHDHTDTVFAEVHGNAYGILRAAIDAQGGVFYPGTPREITDRDGLRVWDDEDAAEIEEAISLIVADGVDVEDLAILYEMYLGHDAEVGGCDGTPECECAARCAFCGEMPGGHFPTWHDYGPHTATT